MDIGDHNCGLCRDYCRDPFPHSLLSTRESSTLGSLGLSLGGFGVELRSFRLSGLGFFLGRPCALCACALWRQLERRFPQLSLY